MKIFTFAVLTAASAPSLMACDLCSIYTAQAAEGSGRGVYVGVAEQFTHYGTLREDGVSVPNTVNQYLDSSVAQLFAGYNFSQRFGVQFNAPLIDRSYQRPRGDVIEQGHLSGLGDVSLTANWIACQQSTEEFTFNWTVLGGVKFPTGDSSRLGEPEVENEPPLPASGIAGHDLALGSGSFDGVVGTGFSTRWKRVFLNGNMQYAIRSEGDFQHEYANDWTWAGGPGVYLALNNRYTLTAQAVVSGESKGKDTFASEPDNDSAATIVYLGPQVNFTWSSKLSAQVGADFPVSIANTGLQIVPDWRVRAALTWHF